MCPAKDLMQQLFILLQRTVLSSIMGMCVGFALGGEQQLATTSVSSYHYLVV